MAETPMGGTPEGAPTPAGSTTSRTGTVPPQVDDESIVYPPERSRWIGWIILTGMLLALLGICQLVAGLVAVVDENYFQASGNAPVFLAVDQQTWGVLQMVLGAAAILTCAGLMYGKVAARVVAMCVVMAAAVTSLLAIGAYPLWSTVLITVDVLILYAIAVHGAEMEPTR